MNTNTSEILFTFCEAFTQLLAGHRLSRKGWNGSNIWVAYGKGQILDADKFWNKHTRKFAEDNGGSAPVGDYFILKSAQGTIEMGWRPTSIDMFAKDWFIVAD